MDLAAEMPTVAAAAEVPPKSADEETKPEPEPVAEETPAPAAPAAADESAGKDESPAAEEPEEVADEVMEDAGEPEEKEEAKPDAPAGRGRRARKSVEAFSVVVEERKEKVIPDGNGEKLEDMPRVVAKFQAVTWSNPHLHTLYSIVFGVGRKKEYKAHLLQFNGLVYPEGGEEKEKERLLAKMHKLTMPQLKDVMDLADIDRSAESFPDKKAPGKEALCTRFLEWLEEPKASGKKVTAASTKKRKSAGSAKKAAPKKGKKTAAKKEAPKKKPAAKKVTPKAAKKAPALDIPGVNEEKLREKVASIVAAADKEELTVKGVRKILEDWLDTDLSEHKDAIRTIVMEVM
ncbi:hypothetical protein ACHAXT_008125 [Thalassiosira profunda]